MYLIIDIGNSFTKFAVFKKFKIKKQLVLSSTELCKSKDLKTLLSADFDAAIISSVRTDTLEFVKKSLQKVPYLIKLSHDTPIPLKNIYKTKATLGADRIAAAVGASNIFPNTNVLIIDAGTALTIDFVSSDNTYRGGVISPGMSMRFRALNEFTNKLPMEKPNVADNNLKGLNTSEAIRYGVQNSMIFEIQSYIEKYSAQYADLKTLLTGGDVFFFENTLKKTIFANSDLVLHGLNRILDYNYAKKN